MHLTLVPSAPFTVSIVCPFPEHQAEQSTVQLLVSSLSNAIKVFLALSLGFSHGAPKILEWYCSGPEVLGLIQTTLGMYSRKMH